MKHGHIETLKIRLKSTFFVIFTLAVFKPFGIDALQWHTCLYLLVFLISGGMLVCMLTDAILKYACHMPHTNKFGVDYIIRRNLLFQFINTPIVSFIICLFRHFILNPHVDGNQLSWRNYLETLLIIGFCSFAIGLYWRFKFRSKFLAVELEDTIRMNEHLGKAQQQNLLVPANTEVPSAEPASNEPEIALATMPTITLSGSTSDSVTLQISDLLYIEAVGNYVKVYRLCEGNVRTDMLRTTSKQIEQDLLPYSTVVRCHRAFLVNITQVERIVSQSGSMQLVIKHCHDSLPVSRSNMSQVKEIINNM